MPKLLVVDDEPDLLRTITRWLAAGADDFSITTAPNAEDALAMALHLPPRKVQRIEAMIH